MEFLAVLLVCALLAAIVLPWINLGRLNAQRREIEQLRGDLGRLKSADQPAAAPRAAAVESPRPVQSPPQEEAPARAAPVAATPPPLPSCAARAPALASSTQTPASAPAQSQDWFGRLAVWVGGVALLMAGFYMIKYSLDSGWMTPQVRVGLTLSFGALLCLAGFVLHRRAADAGNQRIAQALAGAGLGCLYFGAYASVHLYTFLTAGQGFVAMVAVTVLAVGLALRCGAPIALMGLVGGFMTPWLMRSVEANTSQLFIYLFLLLLGAQLICLRRGWWGILLTSIIGAYCWSAGLIVASLLGVIPSLEGAMYFVLGVCAINALWAMVAKPESPAGAPGLSLFSMVRLLVWCGGLGQALWLLLLGGFAGLDIALFGVLSLGALVLACLREAQFKWAAGLGLVAVLVAALVNPATSLVSWLVWPAGLLLVFFAVGHWRSLRSPLASHWQSLSTLAIGLLVPVLFLNRVYLCELPFPGHAFWLLLAVAAAVLVLLAGEHQLRRRRPAAVVAAYQVLAVYLLTFGLWTYMPGAYFAHSLAGLSLLVTFYWQRRGFTRSAWISGVLGLLWAWQMFSLAGEAVAYFFREVFIHSCRQDGVALLAWVLGCLALAALWRAFAAEWPQRARRLLAYSCGAVGLLTLVAAYQWADQFHMPHTWPRLEVAGGLTALLALCALLSRSLRTRFAADSATALLALLVSVRVVALHLGERGAAGERFFFNALLLQFGIPCIAAVLLACYAAAGRLALRRAYQIGAMALGFIWSTFLVQDYFGGASLFGSVESSTELYTYSVVWLLLAVLYQSVGLLRRQRTLHLGSLILLLLTVGKVFLVDASELEGLFRVLSFLGLGVALIAIGFFYNKVVFARGGDSRE